MNLHSGWVHLEAPNISVELDAGATDIVPDIEDNSAA